MNSPVICQSVQLQMADFSAGRLTPVEATVFLQHCADCACCRSEWENFQDTLLLLSGLCQPLPCEDLSDEMWDVCAADWMMHVEMRRSKVPLWGAFRGWTAQQPRWSLVAVSGAVMVFGSIWMLSPANAPSDDNFVASEIPSDGGPLHIFGAQNNAGQGMEFFPYSNSHRVGFATSPLMSSLDHHNYMSAEPFGEPINGGLVSSSSQPIFNQNFPAQAAPIAPQNQPPISSPIPPQIQNQPLISQPMMPSDGVLPTQPAAQPTDMQTIAPDNSAMADSASSEIVSPAATPVSTPNAAIPTATPTLEIPVSH